MQSEIKALRRDVNVLMQEIEVIKNAVLDEGELTDWAKKELEKARREPASSYVTLEEYEARRKLRK